MRSSTDWLRKYRSEGLDSGVNAATGEDRGAGRQIGWKEVDMLFTLLSEIKAVALNDTLADRQTEEIETLGEPAAQR